MLPCSEVVSPIDLGGVKWVCGRCYCEVEPNYLAQLLAVGLGQPQPDAWRHKQEDPSGESASR